MTESKQFVDVYCKTCREHVFLPEPVYNDVITCDKCGTMLPNPIGPTEAEKQKAIELHRWIVKIYFIPEILRRQKAGTLRKGYELGGPTLESYSLGKFKLFQVVFESKDSFKAYIDKECVFGTGEPYVCIEQISPGRHTFPYGFFPDPAAVPLPHDLLEGLSRILTGDPHPAKKIELPAKVKISGYFIDSYFAGETTLQTFAKTPGLPLGQKEQLRQKVTANFNGISLGMDEKQVLWGLSRMLTEKKYVDTDGKLKLIFERHKLYHACEAKIVTTRRGRNEFIGFERDRIDYGLYVLGQTNHDIYYRVQRDSVSPGPGKRGHAKKTEKQYDVIMTQEPLVKVWWHRRGNQEPLDNPDPRKQIMGADRIVVEFNRVFKENIHRYYRMLPKNLVKMVREFKEGTEERATDAEVDMVFWLHRHGKNNKVVYLKRTAGGRYKEATEGRVALRIESNQAAMLETLKIADHRKAKIYVRRRKKYVKDRLDRCYKTAREMGFLIEFARVRGTGGPKEVFWLNPERFHLLENIGTKSGGTT